MLIFESLEMILLRTASDLSHFNMVGNAIVKKTVSGFMKLLQGSFHSDNHRLAWWPHFKSQSEVSFKNESKCFNVFCFGRFVRQCLSFLSALVSQGPEAAREVLSSIHINKALSGLAKRKDKKVCCVSLFHFSGCVGLVWLCRYACVSLTLQGRPDVRMAFIQFALSFLVSGDTSTVGQILEVKGNS